MTTASKQNKTTALEQFTGDRIRPLVPANLQQCMEIADVYATGGMYLAGTDRLQDDKKKSFLVIAFMKALDIGKSPAWAMEYVYVVNSRPCLFGDGPLIMANESGLVEWHKEWIDKEDGDTVAHFEIKRWDRDEPIARKFSITMAKQAKLWGKAGPWTMYPDRMLQLRARSRGLRDSVPEALGGFQIREEIEDIVDIVPKVVDISSLEDTPIESDSESDSESDIDKKHAMDSPDVKNAPEKKPQKNIKKPQNTGLN